MRLAAFIEANQLDDGGRSRGRDDDGLTARFGADQTTDLDGEWRGVLVTIAVAG